MSTLRNGWRWLASVLCCALLSVLVLPGTAATAFRPALPGYKFQFPRDHGSHLEFATEWWYYTGHLRAVDGRRFGYQLTWFRTALAPTIHRQSAWAVRDIYFAHFALTDEAGRRFFFSDRIERGNLGLAAAHVAGPQPPRIFIGDWNLQFGGQRGEKQSFHARALSDHVSSQNQAFSLDLTQVALKPPVIQGENGVSQKSAGRGRASHYYSFTRLQTRGFLTVGSEKLRVEGQSWFDHEFGSNQLDKNQVGWDWFSLQLSDGRELMLYHLRRQDGSIEPYSSGTLVDQKGRAQHLRLADFQLTPISRWKSPQTSASYPTEWRVTLPKLKLDLEVEATLPDQELRPRRSGANLAYWEGSVHATGSQNGRPLSAQGYLELTGYASAFRGTF